MSATKGKKQLAWLDCVAANGVGYAHGVGVVEAARLAEKICQGTTTRPFELAVLWMGKHLALVYHASGHYSDNGGKNYYSSRVELVDLDDPTGRVHYRTRPEVHTGEVVLDKADVERVKKGTLWSHGRLTPNAVQAMVARAMLADDREPARRREENQARKAERETQEQEQQAAKAWDAARKKALTRLRSIVRSTAFGIVSVDRHDLALVLGEEEGS